MKNSIAQSNYANTYFEKQILIALQENFPIKDNESLDSVLAFVHEKLKSSKLHLDYLESELLLVTRKHKLQFIIKDFFKDLRTTSNKLHRQKASKAEQILLFYKKKKKNSKAKVKGNNITPLPFSKKMRKAKNRKPYSSFASPEMTTAQDMVRQIEDEKERVKKALEDKVKIPKVVFTENNEDVLHQ